MTVRKTTNTVGQIPSISKVVDKVARDETPFLSALKREVVADTKHKWYENYGFTTNSGAQAENGEAAPTTFLDTVEKSTYLEIFKSTVSSSGTELATDKAGSFNKMSTQKLELAIAMKKDIERTLMGDQATSIAADVRKLGGVRSQIHADHVRDLAGATTFTANDLVAIGTKAWSAGAKNVSLYVPMEGFNRMSTVLQSGTSVNIDAGTSAGTTGVIVASHMVPGLGKVKIVACDSVKGFAPADVKYDVLGLDVSKFSLLTLKDRYMKEESVDLNGRDGVAEQIITEVGLKHSNSKGGFALINVKK